jgi:predicted RNase H-like HicB family nuclease
MVTKRLTAVITKEGKWYVAKSLEVEVASQGKTMEEALANLKGALELYFEDEHFVLNFQPPVIAPLEIEVDA